MSYNGPNKFQSVSTKFNGDQFTQLIRKLADGFENMIMLLDNARIHTKGVKYLKDIGITVMDFPPKSNDMNVIENVFAELQKFINKKLRAITISTKNQLLELIKKCWEEIPPDFIKKCVLSMPSRLNEVIRMNGMQTRY